MTLLDYPIYGGYGYFGGQPYAVPATAPADPEAKVKPDNALERPIGVGGIGYFPGNDPAPPWNLADALLMRGYPAVQAVLKAIICPIIAATRSFEARNEDGTDAPKSKQIGPRTGDGVTADPVDKLKDALEEYHRPQWPDILTMLEAVHWGWWIQEPIYERAETPIGPLTLAGAYRDFLPWEVQPRRDPFGQFAGFTYLNGKGDEPARTRGPEYALHFTEGGHLDPLFGWGRSKNAMMDWWRVRQSHLNGDRLERKPTTISLLIEMMRGVDWRDAAGNKMTDQQYAQLMYDSLSSGGTFVTHICPFPPDVVKNKPELASIPFARATQFDWGNTGPAQAAQLSRAAALDANIVRCYGRKERSLFAAERGGIGTSDAGTHKDSDELDGEQIHEAACRAFSRQVLNVELVTNRGPAMRDRIWVKAGKLSDDDKTFKRTLALARAAQPGSPLGQMLDDQELAESTGIPIDPDKPLLPPLTPNAPPAGNVPPGQPPTNGNGRTQRLGLSGANGRGSRPFVGSGCGANAAGGGGFQPGNTCAKKAMGRAINRLADLTGPKGLEQAFPDTPKYAGGIARHDANSPAVREDIGRHAGELAKDATAEPLVENADRRTIGRAYTIDLSAYPAGPGREGITALADKAGRITVAGQPHVAIVTGKGEAGKLLRGMERHAGDTGDVLSRADAEHLWERSTATAIDGQYKPLTASTWIRGGEHVQAQLIDAAKVPADVRVKATA